MSSDLTIRFSFSFASIYCSISTLSSGNREADVLGFEMSKVTERFMTRTRFFSKDS
jgi:hypothetical protein